MNNDASTCMISPTGHIKVGRHYIGLDQTDSITLIDRNTTESVSLSRLW